MARPTDYKKEYDELAYKYCLLGATDKKLGEFFCVSEQTINSWKHKHPTFLESLKAGKEIADAEVAEAFYHRAKGYSHRETKIFFRQNPTPGQDEIVSVDIIKQYPPDTAAGFIWLKNRAGWKDKQERELSGEVGIKPMKKWSDVRSGDDGSEDS